MELGGQGLGQPRPPSAEAMLKTDSSEWSLIFLLVLDCSLFFGGVLFCKIPLEIPVNPKLVEWV